MVDIDKWTTKQERRQYSTAPCLTPESTLKTCDQLLLHLTDVRQLDIVRWQLGVSCVSCRLRFTLSKILVKSVALIFIVLLHKKVLEN